MAAIINTNVVSLNAQRNLSSSQNALATSLQRLSSGMRINSAKDDAAGLAISERMTSQIRGLNQAARNANDGISMSQTAEGALGEIGNNLQRIRELAVQSRNASNSVSDRQALNNEVQQVKSEIDRVASSTSFNGTKLIDGSFTNQSFQVGANVGETISISSLVDARSSSLGTSTSSTANVTGAAATGFTAITAGDLTVNGVSVGAVAAGGNAATQGANIAAAINTISSTTNVTATADAAGKVTLTNVSGSTTVVAFAGASATTATTGLTAGTTAVTTATGSGFANLDISNTANADFAIAAMDSALSALNAGRADLGAYQNRFSSAIANVQTTAENLSASRSRIVDTDFAAETATLSRNQVLQQAGTAMLTQANAMPQSVLALLRG
jgi:flagellin